MINNIFNTHNVLVCRTTPNHDLQFSFTTESKEELTRRFDEYLAEEFEPEDIAAANNVDNFQEFMINNFEPDEIQNELDTVVYYDVVNGFGRDEEDEDHVYWAVDICEK